MEREISWEINEGKYKRLYEGILASIPSSILLIDSYLRITSANRNFLEKSKRSRSNTLGMKIDEVFPPVLLEYTGLNKKVREVFNTGRPVDGGQLTYRAPGLPIRIYFYGLTPIKDGLGKVEHVMLLMDDVTEKKELDKEVRKIERHLASVVESAGDIVVSMDPEETITTWNSAGENISGHTLREVIGRPLVSLCVKGHKTMMDSALAQLKRGSSVKDIQINFLTKGGEEIPVSWAFSPMRDDEGQLVGIVGVGRDLTERKRFEEQLIRSAKMASLGVMAGGIAHEIRNPLGICSSLAQLLLENQDDRELARECATKIHTNILRASKTIENLLRFARPPEEIFESLDVRVILDETLSLIANQVVLQQITIEKDISPYLSLTSGNRNLLQHVFLNVILNAANAMPHGGKLILKVEEESDEWLKVQFIDTGCGISREDLPKIFDPFFTTMPVGRGTGLGLSISYGIVCQHGGSIGVESEVGKGSTVMIKLPVYHG